MDPVTWVYIALMVVSFALSYAMRPKATKPDAVTATVPTTDEGKGVVEIYGTVWIDDSMVIAFKALTPIPIKKSGGKK